ncbi:MAG: hypothetical protein ABSE73_00910 [Planctomycetota bacterium]
MRALLAGHDLTELTADEVRALEEYLRQAPAAVLATLKKLACRENLRRTLQSDESNKE